MDKKKTATKKRAKTGGRSKGVPNKVTATVKQAIAEALDDGKGAKAFFVKLKGDNPTTFATIAAKLIPIEVEARIDTSLEVTIVR